MPVRYQLVIDCADPEVLTRFWAEALGYEVESPPPGFATWDDWRRAIGLPEEALGGGADSIVDPTGNGPRIWFQVVSDARSVKNRLHIDVHASGEPGLPLATRKERVDAEARRLTDLGATFVRDLSQEGIDHYAVAMLDPEGNEFDIN
jgi:hypothetical protein